MTQKVLDSNYDYKSSSGEKHDLFSLVSDICYMENDLAEPRSLDNVLFFVKCLIWFFVFACFGVFVGHIRIDTDNIPHNHYLWEVLGNVMRGGLYASFLSYYVVKIGVRNHIRKRFAPQVKEWVSTRYGIELSNEDALTLASRTPSDKEIDKTFYYHSLPLTRWQTNSQGTKYAETIFLLGVDGEMILFENNSQQELETVWLQDYKVFFGTLWSEVREQGGLFTFREETSERASSTPKVFIHDGTENYVFWSDELRVQLYRSAFIPASEIGYIPLADFAEYVLPMMIERGIMVGLNWGEETRSFEPQDIERLILS